MKERELLSHMDDDSVEQIAEFSEGLDKAAKQRILENCRKKMKNDSKTRVINMKKNSNEYTEEIRAEIKPENSRSRNIKPLVSVAACLAVIIGAGALLTNLRGNDGNGNINVNPVPAADVTQETSQAVSESEAESENPGVSSESVTESLPPVTSVSEVFVTGTSGGTAEINVQITSVSETVSAEEQADEVFKNAIIIAFEEDSKELSRAYEISCGFGIHYNKSGEMVWYDDDTGEVYYYGDADSTHEFADFDNHPHGVRAYEVSDSINTNQEYYDYLCKYFTDNYINKYCGGGKSRFIEYNGKFFEREPGKGLLFSGWDAENAVITEYEQGKSYTIYASGVPELGENALFGTIKFVSDGNGYKIDDIIYQ